MTEPIMLIAFLQIFNFCYCLFCFSICLSQQEPGTVQIPIGNNTGSLPDLTSFHFPSPLPTPLDQEDHNSSTYSNVSINYIKLPVKSVLRVYVSNIDIYRILS